MNQGVGIVIDLAIIVVMGLAVFYAVRLNRSLARARDGRAELIQLIASLSEALARADIAVKSMKSTATEYELSLQKHMAVSQALIEELGIINDTGNGIANRLERLAPQARAGAREAAYENEPPAPSTNRGSLPPLRAERLGDVKRQPAAAAPTAAAPAATQAKAEPNPAIVSLATRTAGGGNPEEKPRSRAERELFDALETLRKGKPS